MSSRPRCYEQHHGVNAAVREIESRAIRQSEYATRGRREVAADAYTKTELLQLIEELIFERLQPHFDDRGQLCDVDRDCRECCEAEELRALRARVVPRVDDFSDEWACEICHPRLVERHGKRAPRIEGNETHRDDACWGCGKTFENIWDRRE